jgi:hypothetical protein
VKRKRQRGRSFATLDASMLDPVTARVAERFAFAVGQSL